MIDTAKGKQNEPYSEILYITTNMAAAWLDQNETNRPINWNYVSQLARDMRAGRFVCTHQGIAFDTNGRLIDGQHRLWAILEADVPVRIRVFFNEPPDNLIYIDGNHPRRAADRMTLGRTLGTVRTDELATLRAMLGGIALAKSRHTVVEEMRLLEKYRQPIQFAHEHLSVSRPAGIANAMTRAVLARAWFCVTDHRILAKFCETLRTNLMTTDFDRPVALLRDQLVELRKHGNTKPIRQRQYALASRALAAYIDNQPLMILRATSYELFLLPEEVQ
jgi:hypothetical protein